MDETLQDFFLWSKEHGICVRDVESIRTQDRGLSICAVRPIKAGTEVISVPASALLHPDRLPPAFRKRLPPTKCSIHALLAAFLTTGEAEDVERLVGPWRATWPSLEDFARTMPLLQHSAEAREAIAGTRDPDRPTLLPPSIVGWRAADAEANATPGLLGKQEARFERHWATVSGLLKLPPSKKADFRFHWLIVNTRSFHYDFGSLAKIQDKEDRMVLCPFMDFFNHANKGCSVEYNEDGYSVTADRDYEAGEELLVSYGEHSNDALWVDYGFMLEGNSSDAVTIDGLVMPALVEKSPLTRLRLETDGYLGDYTLSSDGICYRTLAAGRSRTSTTQEWAAFVQGREGSLQQEARDRKAAALIRKKVLEPCLHQAFNASYAIRTKNTKDLVGVPEELISMAGERWNKIWQLTKQAMERSDIS